MQANSAMQNSTLNIIKAFAKANKYSATKLEAFAQEIIASIPKEEPKGKRKVITNGIQGRPMLDSTKQLHQRIMNAIGFGYTTSPDIAYITGIKDKAALQNALNTLQSQGKITKGQKVHTGKQGRQPFSFKLV